MISPAPICLNTVGPSRSSHGECRGMSGGGSRWFGAMGNRQGPGPKTEGGAGDAGNRVGEGVAAGVGAGGAARPRQARPAAGGAGARRDPGPGQRGQPAGAGRGGAPSGMRPDGAGGARRPGPSGRASQRAVAGGATAGPATEPGAAGGPSGAATNTAERRAQHQVPPGSRDLVDPSGKADPTGPGPAPRPPRGSRWRPPSPTTPAADEPPWSCRPAEPGTRRRLRDPGYDVPRVGPTAPSRCAPAHRPGSRDGGSRRPRTVGTPQIQVPPPSHRPVIGRRSRPPTPTRQTPGPSPQPHHHALGSKDNRVTDAPGSPTSC